MIAKTPEEIQQLRKAGALLAQTLRMLVGKVHAGVTTAELDLAAEEHIRAGGGIPSFLNYKPDGARYAYPAALCVAINDEVVHGIPSSEKILQDGDIVSLDLGLSYNGYFVDSAVTVGVGEVDEESKKLLAANHEALAVSIAAAKVGAHVGDIGAAGVRIAQKYNLGVVEELGGHAVGKAVHEKPFIANDGVVGEGAEIVEGMVLAIEPMFALGSGKIKLDKDQWTYRMKDGKRAAHFEHTVLITKNGPEILTQ